LKYLNYLVLDPLSLNVRMEVDQDAKVLMEYPKVNSFLIIVGLIYLIKFIFMISNIFFTVYHESGFV